MRSVDCFTADNASMTLLTLVPGLAHGFRRRTNSAAVRTRRLAMATYDGQSAAASSSRSAVNFSTLISTEILLWRNVRISTTEDSPLPYTPAQSASSLAAFDSRETS